jgi:hypothetical protein
MKTLQGILDSLPVKVRIKKPVRKGEHFEAGDAIGIKHKFGRVMVQVSYPVYLCRGHITSGKQLFDWIDIKDLEDLTDK